MKILEKFSASGLAGERHARAGRIVLVGIVAAALLSPVPTSAKKKPPTTKTVTGTVFDARNVGIANAVVSLTDLTDKKKVAIYSEPDGSFEFSGLSFNHDYELRASYKGESSEERKISSWDTRDRLVMYLHIPPPAEQ